MDSFVLDFVVVLSNFDIEYGVTVHPSTFPNNLVLTSSFPTLSVDFAWWVGRAVRIVVMCRKNICESSAFPFSSALMIFHPKKREISLGLYLQLYPTV